MSLIMVLFVVVPMPGDSHLALKFRGCDPTPVKFACQPFAAMAPAHHFKSTEMFDLNLV